MNGSVLSGLEKNACESFGSRKSRFLLVIWLSEKSRNSHLYWTERARENNIELQKNYCKKNTSLECLNLFAAQTEASCWMIHFLSPLKSSVLLHIWTASAVIEVTSKRADGCKTVWGDLFLYYARTRAHMSSDSEGCANHQGN